MQSCFAQIHCLQVSLREHPIIIQDCEDSILSFSLDQKHSQGQVLTLSKEVFCFVLNCGKTHVNLKSTIPTIFKCKVQWHYVFSFLCQHHQHLSQNSFRLAELKLYPLDNNSPFFPLPGPGNYYSTFCLYEFVSSRYLI